MASIFLDSKEDMGKDVAGRGDKLISNGNALWYKDAVIYQVHVKTFFDSNGDGVGDFKGLTQKLDYLQDLGVTALWLQPFCPSPLKDDGYDIAGYTGVHRDYGTLTDFKNFLREAHQRKLRVITELVVNHTSDQHPWFQRARNAKPGSRWRDFYVWSDTPDRYEETRIIFPDFESSNWAWDPVANAYYWHRFYSHQPDLNYDNPSVQKAILRVLDFWFGMGVDGLRLDAVPYLYEREGTSCENLPETHRFLKRMRAHVDAKFENRMFLGEANQWPEDAAAYFGNGNECHMAFHFPLMPRLFMAIRMEDSFPIIDILEQTPPIPETCQWAVFLRNHDELTLEMVTDEERDFMYRVYAQDARARINLGIRRRLAPLLENNRRRIELMTCLLMSMPGTPVIYYGDEIGMGDNIYLGDRNGVRTPMQWSPDRNAGFSRANPQQLYLPIIIDPEYHYEVVNVEAQQKNLSSLLWWHKRLITMRNRIRAFSRGSFVFLQPDNHKILAFARQYGDETVLVVANLSRFVQNAELDLRPYQGRIPIEVFGQTAFPAISELPYPLTLGPHSFYWLRLKEQRASEAGPGRGDRASQLPVLETGDLWQDLFSVKKRTALEVLLPKYLQERRWFGSKAREIRSARIQDVLTLRNASSEGLIALVQVKYVDGEDEAYVLPISYATGEQLHNMLREHPEEIMARCLLRDKAEEGVLYDALRGEDFCRVLLRFMTKRQRKKGPAGELIADPGPCSRGLPKEAAADLAPSVLKTEQSNTSVVYGEAFILKFFRRLQAGVNPELEVGRCLTERRFEHIPSLRGSLEYRRGHDEPMTMALLQEYVPNRGDAWSYTLNVLGRFLEDVLSQHIGLDGLPEARGSLLELSEKEIPQEISHCIGGYLDSARLLGERTAELHIALSLSTQDPRFAPEPFSKLYQRSLYQSMRSLTGRVFMQLRKQLENLEGEIHTEARAVLEQRDRVMESFQSLLSSKIDAWRIRCHGDYHLGQVLYTGRDFVIIDFEGEPARPISERRIKRSALRDVAGMIRSFHYAAYGALFSQQARVLAGPEHYPHLEAMTAVWHTWVSAAFLKAYLAAARQAQFLPRSAEEVGVLLNSYLMEKAVYELGYELNNRPEWLKIPIAGILGLLRETG